MTKSTLLIEVWLTILVFLEKGSNNVGMWLNSNPPGGLSTGSQSKCNDIEHNHKLKACWFQQDLIYVE